MIQKNRKRRLNNGGMSLVEVIISMVILSVVVIGVLQSLTTAMIYNKKARVKQDTTIKGESIMELFKGYNMDEMYQMFAAGGGDVGTMIGSGAYAVTGNDPADETLPSSDLTFTIDGLVISSAGGGSSDTYSVQIVAKPVPEVDLFATQKFDPATDAIFISDESYDNDARSGAYTQFLGTETAGFVTYLNGMKTDSAGNSLVCDVDGNDYTEATIGSYLDIDDICLTERKTIFDISDSGVTVRMIFRYKIYGFEYYEKIYPEETSDTYGTDEYGGGSTEPATSTPGAFAGELHYLEYPASGDLEYEVTISANPVATMIPKRLYAYYYPQYDESSYVDFDGSIHSRPIDDKIEINDTRSDQSEAVDCFLIKQKRTGLSDATIHVKESGYKLTDLSTSGNLNVYDNFSEDISDGDPLTGKDVTGSTYYMDDSNKEADILAYALELTVTNSAGNVVTRLVSSTNER